MRHSLVFTGIEFKHHSQSILLLMSLLRSWTHPSRKTTNVMNMHWLAITYAPPIVRHPCMAGLGPLLERWRQAPPKPHYCYVHSPTTATLPHYYCSFHGTPWIHYYSPLHYYNSCVHQNTRGASTILHNTSRAPPQVALTHNLGWDQNSTK